jgi:hypothetical protein
VDNLVIEATKSSPYVRFDASAGVLVIKGKCYPENAAKFFCPIISWLKEFLLSSTLPQVWVEMELTYFNSSSSKALMNFLEMLEGAASAGKAVVVNWRYHEENDTALEAGEEFQDEVPAVTFNFIEIPGE